MRYNKISADVLNEADRQERIMTWQIFCAEQEAMLWDYAGTSKEKWQPGRPIWAHPKNRNFFIENGISYREATRFNGPSATLGGNYTRPMFETFPVDQIEPPGLNCLDCDVSWDIYQTQECWNCGKLSHRIRREPARELTAQDLDGDTSLRYATGVDYGTIFRGASDSLEPLARIPVLPEGRLYIDGEGVSARVESFRGLRISDEVIDELMVAPIDFSHLAEMNFHYEITTNTWFSEFAEALWGSQFTDQSPMHSFAETSRRAGAAMSQMQTYMSSIFATLPSMRQQIEDNYARVFHAPPPTIELPRPAIAEFIPERDWREAWGEFRRHRGRRVVIPAAFDRFGRVEPEMPQLDIPEIDYSQFSYRPAYVELTREGRR